MERSTRSGKTFAEWDGPVIMPSNNDFDFPDLVRKAIALEDLLYSAAEEAEEAEEMEDYPQLSSSFEDSDSDSEKPVSPPHATSPTPLPNPYRGQPAQQQPAQQSQPSSLNNHEGSTDTEESAQQRRKRKKRAREHVARQKRRQNDPTFSRHTACPAIQEKYVKTAVPILSAQNLEETRNVASTGWVGLDDRVRDDHEYTLDELVGPSSKFKFEYVAWAADKPIPIISREGILTAVLAGKPDQADWPRLEKEAIDLLKSADRRCRVPATARVHRRGAFVALQSGVSHGGGQRQPSNLRCGCRTNAKILEELNKAEPFRRVAGFADSVMANWAPDLHAYYSRYLTALHAKYPHLRRNFASSVFAASTYNLGPKTVCFRHTDLANLPFGWCAVTAFGDFDPTKGGHLILWDCHLVIEFPPGATILLPSATVTHSNVPISENETRFSFAQYTAGALLRWVENGFQKATAFVASLSEEKLAEKLRNDQNRWSFGLSLLPRYPLPPPSTPSM